MSRRACGRRPNIADDKGFVMVNPTKRAGSGSARLAMVIGLIGLLPLAAAATWPRDAGDFTKLKSGPGLMNHPIGVIPSRSVQIPADWPLDASGALTCRTCHEKLPSLDGKGEPNLRGTSDFSGDSASFCTNCHDAAKQHGTLGMHWMAVGRAHVNASRESDRHAFGSLDSASLGCLSCHDGVTAPETGYTTAGGHGGGRLDDAGRNHPVGVPYTTMRQGKSTHLRGQASLPPQVRLPNGRVSCISCHNLYSESAKLLSVPIEESALCFTCHEMD